MVDVSCQPIVNIDVSYQPIINVDVSYQPVITVDVSCTAVVPSNLQVAYNANSGITDAFSRLRVSNPYTLFEFNSILGHNPLLIDELSGGTGASITHSTDSYVALNVTTINDVVIRQSHEYILYQPGKSKLIFLTGVLSTAANVTSRIGTFDISMGFFIEVSGGVISVVKRVGGTDNKVGRTSGLWTDPLDGTGPSGANVDFSKAQIFMFDMEWLGVGQVRCAIVQGGAIHYYYTFTHINSLTEPYVPMAKLPVRYEIRCNSNGAASMRMICGTVISEGGFSPMGRSFSYGLYDASGSFHIPAGGVFFPIMALRIRSTERFNRVTMKLKTIDIFDLTNNTWGSWKVLLNPTIINGGAWISVDAARDSAVEYMDISYNGARTPTTTATGGFVLYSDYYITRTNSIIAASTDELVAAQAITTGLSGVPDTIVLMANNTTTGGGGNACDLLALIKWIEFM